MKVKVIYNTIDFYKIQHDWCELFVSYSYSVFQSFEFNYYSWVTELSKNKSNSLRVVLFMRNKQLVSILPLYLDSRNRLRFINDKHADFCDFLSIEQFNFSQIIEILRREIKFNSIQLINIKKEAKLFQIINNKSYENCIVKCFERAPFLYLDMGSFPDNYPKYKSKSRTEFRRIQKKNSDMQHILLRAAESKFPIDDILYLKREMIATGIRKKEYLSSLQINLIKELYYSKRLILSVVKSEKKTHAISFILVNSDEFLFWIDMFDNSLMVNLFNYFCLLRKLSAEKKVTIHFGRGAYNYKIVNFKPDIEQLFSVFVFRNKYQLVVYSFINYVKTILKLMYKKIMR